MAAMGVHAAILAGGAGTRLWPRSRRGRPKHLLSLQRGEAPLLRQTFERIRPLVDEVHVVTERHQRDQILEVLPELDTEHVILEPVARGTASALGLAAMAIAENDPGAVMLSLPADHIVGDNRRFRQTIRRVVRLAALSSQLVTVGLTPYYPATGFGYMRTNGEARFGRTTGLRVLEFIEKPSFERASTFVETGDYYWNLAMFCWRVETLVSELARHSPVHHQTLSQVLALRRNGEDAAADALYGELPKDAIDYAVMEKTDQLLLIPARFHWIDVGSWSELHAILPKDLSGNSINGDHVLIDSESSLFDVPNKFVAAIGVRDLVVVDSGDALLVCQKSRTQDVKLLVEQMRSGRFGAYA